MNWAALAETEPHEQSLPLEGVEDVRHVDREPDELEAQPQLF